MNIHVIRENSLNIPRGLYTDWLGNGLPSVTENALIAEGAAIVTNIQSPVELDSISLDLAVTTSRTATLSDVDKTLACNSASAINITIPPSTTTNFPDGTILSIYQVGTGASTFIAGAGVTIEGTQPTSAQYQHIGVRNRTGDIWAWV